MVTKKIEEKMDRYTELYEGAMAVYLEKSNFIVTEWLDKEDAREFLKLQDSIFGTKGKK